MVDRDKFSDYGKSISFLDARARVPPPIESTEPLPVDFEPGNWDVICQGGKDSYDHVGNRRFRLCIENNLLRYMQATSKHERSLVVSTIVDAIRDSRTSENGGFVRKDVSSGRWYEVGDKTAREKVGHALRDAIKFKNRVLQFQSFESHDKDEPKHHAKKRKRAMNVPVPQRDANSSQITKSSPCATKSVRKSVSYKILNQQRKENMHTLDSASTALVEAEWEISLKESTKQFQNSDDESELVVEDNLHNSELIVKQVADKNPSPVHSATKSLKPPPAMTKDIGKNTSRVRNAGMETSGTWSPPGLVHFEDQFAQYMRSFGALKDQPVGGKGEASMTTPFPKTLHHNGLEHGSRNIGMPQQNDTAPSIPCCEPILIYDSMNAATCLRH